MAGKRFLANAAECEVNGVELKSYYYWESAFMQYPEYLEDYLPWDPIIQKICR